MVRPGRGDDVWGVGVAANPRGEGEVVKTVLLSVVTSGQESCLSLWEGGLLIRYMYMCVCGCVCMSYVYLYLFVHVCVMYICLYISVCMYSGIW